MKLKPLLVAVAIAFSGTAFAQAPKDSPMKSDKGQAAVDKDLKKDRKVEKDAKAAERKAKRDAEAAERKAKREARRDDKKRDAKMGDMKSATPATPATPPASKAGGPATPATPATPAKK
jgi:hypothetical protein